MTFGLKKQKKHRSIIPREHVSIFQTVWEWLTSVTDRQTDRQTEWPLAIALSNAVGRVLIMMLCNVDDHCR